MLAAGHLTLAQQQSAPCGDYHTIVLYIQKSDEQSSISTIHDDATAKKKYNGSYCAMCTYMKHVLFGEIYKGSHLDCPLELEEAWSLKYLALYCFGDISI